MPTLFVVATPIGNLEDLTQRAAGVLRRAEVVFAEDTRRTRILMAHLGAPSTPVRRLDANASPAQIEALLDEVAALGEIAVATDAGTPAVSDPGAAVVSQARARGFTIVPLPGPSAVVTALSASGYAMSGFSFVGFLPRAGNERATALSSMEGACDAVVFFESPNRLAATLAELASRQPARRVFIARELTKLHEELLEGSLADLAADAATRSWLGEITVVLAPFEARAVRASDDEVARLVDAGLASGVRAKDLSERLAFETGWSKRELYQLALARKPRRGDA